jgi:hypothetical protein
VYTGGDFGDLVAGRCYHCRAKHTLSYCEF